MKEKQEISSRNSNAEQNAKKFSNSIENLVYNINDFCRLLEENEKRYKRIKEKYYINICCFYPCLKDKYKNNERIIKEINDIKEERDALNEKLELMSEYYMNQREKEINKDYFSCISKKSLLILIFSIFHFYAIAEINGYLYSLFGEIKRSSDHIFNGYYNTTKNFSDFFTNSTLTDSSQINFNYFTSIFTSYFICKFSIMTLYFFSSLALYGFICLISIFKFLDKESIINNYNYEDKKSIFTLIFYYIAIYFFAGLIALLPYEILKMNKKINSWDLLLMNFFLTFAVIVKNLLHNNFELFKSPSTCGLFYISSSFIYFIYPFIIWFNNKFKDNKNDNDNENIYINNQEDTYNVENNDRNKTNAINYQNDDKSINDESLIEFGYDDIDEGKIIQMLNINQEQNPNNKSEENEKKIYFNPIFILGCLIIQFNKFIISITIKGFLSYIWSILSDKKIILIILINLLSRAQKLKFKTIYKNEFSKSIYYLIGNFGLSYLILLFFSIYFYLKVKNKKIVNNQKILKIKECYIINAIIIDDFFVLIFSILNIIFANPIFSYLSISIGGNFNFLLYEYYSTIEREYISMSGFISLAQIIFRILELIFEPCKDYWLRLQIVISILGIIFSLIYFKLVIINEAKNEVDNNLDNYQEIRKNIFNYQFYILFIILIMFMSAFIFYIISNIKN